MTSLRSAKNRGMWWDRSGWRYGRSGWSDGLTLVEMLISIVLLSVVFAVATPLVADRSRQSAARAGADEFVFAHAHARATAVKYGRHSELHLEPSTGRFWIAVDTSGTGGRDTVGFVHDLGETGVAVVANQNLLCFDARGVASGRGACADGMAIIVFTAGRYSDTLMVTAAGIVVR